MSLWVVLEVAIGLAFVYLLLALFISALHELVAAYLRWRGKYLWDALASLLGGADSDLFKHVLTHPVVAPAASAPTGANQAAGGGAAQPATDRASTPSYIPARNFAVAVLDWLRKGKIDADIKKAIEGLPDGEVKKTLTAIYAEVRDDGEKFKQRIETWFDDAMDRLSGVYKRWTQQFAFWFGVLAALLFNVDSINVARTLWVDPNMRAAMVAAAEKYVSQNPSPETAVAPPADQAAKAAADKAAVDKAIEEARQRLENVHRQVSSLPLPLGWSDPPQKTKPGVTAWADLTLWEKVDYWLRHIVASAATALPGWIITALAVSLGATFWFDTLKMLINIRGTGPKPERSPATRARDSVVETEAPVRQIATPTDGGVAPTRVADRAAAPAVMSAIVVPRDDRRRR